MCYSGQCDFENHMGDCRLKSHMNEEIREWCENNGFNFCGTGLDPEDYYKRDAWIENNPKRFKEFKDKFVW